MLLHFSPDPKRKLWAADGSTSCLFCWASSWISPLIALFSLRLWCGSPEKRLKGLCRSSRLFFSPPDQTWCVFPNARWDCSVQSSRKEIMGCPLLHVIWWTLSMIACTNQSQIVFFCLNSTRLPCPSELFVLCSNTDWIGLTNELPRPTVMGIGLIVKCCS